MLYQKKGDTVLDSGKVFTVGGEVFANHACDYEGLFGTVTEIRTGPDQCAEQGAPDICCAFQPPESRAMVEDIQERFSARFRHPKHLEDLGLDCVILAPSMLEPLPERMPAEDGRLLSLTCFYDSDCGCNAQTLALSNDMGLVLRKMREDLDTYEIPDVLSHEERRLSFFLRGKGRGGGKPVPELYHFRRSRVPPTACRPCLNCVERVNSGDPGDASPPRKASLDEK